MQYRVLGRTGVSASLLGLGTGTRFGTLAGGATADDRLRLVRTALELGVNYFDTAPLYGEAEQLLGRALRGVPREEFIVATKFFPVQAADMRAVPPGAPVITPDQLRASVEGSLDRLGCGHLDILQAHGLRPHWREPVFTVLGGTLEALRREGKFRLLGVSETIVEDPRHEMAAAAARDPAVSVATLGYHLLSPWAEKQALPVCQERGVGVVAMVSVGRSLSQPAHLAALLARTTGCPALARLPADGPLDWLLSSDTPSLAVAGCKFAAAHPAVACVLAGTLDPVHLRENAAAVNGPPLPAEHAARLRELFLAVPPETWRLRDL